jgi:long-chain acyl-CoA synthetase
MLTCLWPNAMLSIPMHIERDIYTRFAHELTLDGELLCPGVLLRHAARRFPEKIALIDQSAALSYAQLYARAQRASAFLRYRDVCPGDHVLLYFENSIDFYVFYWAIWQCGAIVVPINTFLHERELTHVINDCKPKLCITHTALAPKIRHAANELLDVVTEQDFVEAADGAPLFEPVMRPAGACVALLYTSGTSGVPKGVMLTSQNVMVNTLQAAARFWAITGGPERFLAVLPLFHAFAQNTCIWLPAITGSSVIVVPRIERRALLEGLQKKPTVFLGFPALYGLLCLMKTAPLETVKIFVSGADALSDRIRSAFAMLYGRRICSGYGLTEASPVVSINHVNEEYATNVVGAPLVGLEVEVRDDEGRSVPSNTVGALWIRGGNVMAGYHNAPEATAAVLKDGWLNTGDLASCDAYGVIAMRGRSKDVIIHKGFNIYPQEVENILLKHPAIVKAAVIGEEEAATGQIPVAYVAIKQRAHGIEEELRLFCSNHLATYKIPRRFVCLDDLPMLPTGKIDKKRLHHLHS